MILIDSLFINSQGGINLLRLIINYVKSSEEKYFFLIDDRLKNKIDVNGLKVVFAKSSIFNRHLFYFKNKLSFTSVFCFANLPPTISLDCVVYTFFQNVNMLNPDHNKSVKNFIKNIFLKVFKENTNFWIVQTNFTKKMLSKNKINVDKIKVIPFFSDQLKKKRAFDDRDTNKEYKCLNFFYPSDGEKHKNHLKLINAFSNYNIINRNSKLILTIDKKYTRIIKKINNEINQGTKIINLGILNQQDLHAEYLKTDVVIFPSLGESLGLGLIEACTYNIPIFASDLEYVHEIIKPSAIFDPFSEKSILKTLSLTKGYLPIKPKLKISNKIHEIFDLISSNKC